METTKDGGPAFARVGLTLRDYFAGQALMGMLASPHWDQQVDQSADPNDPWAHAARASYTFADAMLKARGAVT